MKFDVYGRFQVEVLRENDGWVLRRVEQGRRLVLEDWIIPPDVPADQISRWLEDLLHEFASPDRMIRRLD
jgi:hypothetical protein